VDIENNNMFGSRIRKVRNHLKLNQTVFAKNLGISVTNVSESETGKSSPGYDFFSRMSTVYNVNLNYLFTGKGEMFMDAAEHSTVEVTSPEYDKENVDVQKFLDYFFKSKIVQYQVLAYFLKLLGSDREQIDKELAGNKGELK
jgi:transcriptional regulator with XRE-family HTH domain